MRVFALMSVGTSPLILTLVAMSSNNHWVARSDSALSETLQSQTLSMGSTAPRIPPIPEQFSPPSTEAMSRVLPPDEPEGPPDALQILRCYGQVGDANFRFSPGMVSQSPQNDPNIRMTIPSGSTVERTGQVSGFWVEVTYAGLDGWIHQCWQ